MPKNSKHSDKQLAAWAAQDSLSREILQWLPSFTQQEAWPPTLRRKTLKQHSASFVDANEFIDSFRPLFILELWEQIRQACTALNEGGTMTVLSYKSVYGFTEVVASIARSDMPPGVDMFSSVDLVLLKRDARQTLAKVVTFKDKGTFFEIKLRLQLSRDNTHVDEALFAGIPWLIYPVYNLVTALREHAALASVSDLPLLPSILKAAVPYPKLPTAAAIVQLMESKNLNKAQARAVLAATTTPGLNLIQGPPGTGKSKTIMAMIEQLLKDRQTTANLDPMLLVESAPRKDKKLLVCARSNAAVDELARRIKALSGSDSQDYFAVRIGRLDATALDVKDIHIDSLVDDCKAGMMQKIREANELAQRIDDELEKLRKDKDELQLDFLSNTAGGTTLDGELRQKAISIEVKMQALLVSKKDAIKTVEALRAKKQVFFIQGAILGQADIILATLSSSGSNCLVHLDATFETVICDEAAQTTEFSSLIPLQYGCKRYIMVGDPAQLPPTVKSTDAVSRGYSRSLFARLMEVSPASVHLLSTQYRMHPSISAFPSKAFYADKVVDAPNMANLRRQDWHSSPALGPYAFITVEGTELRDQGLSLSNLREAETVLAVFQAFERQCPDIDFADKVAIISPYQGQVMLLRRIFEKAYGKFKVDSMAISTVDSFQGQEQPVVILSCVRAGPEVPGVGFLSDKRRMNVALTRAQSSLVVVGDVNRLCTNHESFCVSPSPLFDPEILAAVVASSNLGPDGSSSSVQTAKSEAVTPAVSTSSLEANKRIASWLPNDMDIEAELAEAEDRIADLNLGIDLGTTTNPSSSCATKAPSKDSATTVEELDPPLNTSLDVERSGGGAKGSKASLEGASGGKAAELLMPVGRCLIF